MSRILLEPTWGTYCSTLTAISYNIKYSISKFAAKIEFWGVADMTKTETSTWRDLEKLEDWANRNLKFNTEKRKLLHLRQNPYINIGWEETTKATVLL